MLVLSRKESERIRVGDSIVVTVVRLTKDRVRLGIEAPEDVLVLRDELEKEGDFLSEEVPEERPVRRGNPMGLKSMVKEMRHGRRFSEETEECVVATEETRKAPPRRTFRW
ncbi:MAG: carbon storage regulator [Planctomycetia bacterium]|nr:carbon storage regulator [Planctomycetia bacterium]